MGAVDEDDEDDELAAWPVEGGTTDVFARVLNAIGALDEDDDGAKRLCVATKFVRSFHS